MNKMSHLAYAIHFPNAMKPNRRKQAWREFLGRIWLMIGALVLIVTLNECARTDAEVQSGVVDIGDGLVAKPDGTVVEAWSLPGAQAAPPWPDGLQVWSAWSAPTGSMLMPIPSAARRAHERGD
jgi:hypothetical protein